MSASYAGQAIKAMVADALDGDELLFTVHTGNCHKVHEKRCGLPWAYKWMRLTERDMVEPWTVFPVFTSTWRTIERPYSPSLS